MTISFRLEPPRPQESLDVVPFHQWKSPDGNLWAQFFRLYSGYMLRFPDLADFQISGDGYSATCSPAPTSTEATANHLYLNQVRPLMLSKQGKLVFHASAIELGGGAVAFVAGSGRGKSTLAASFAISGFRFLSDDGLELETSGESYYALPSHSSIRLWEDSAEALILPGAQRAPALEYTVKSRFLSGDGVAFCDQVRPLCRVYFLGDGSVPEATFARISGAEVLLELVKNSFLLDIEEKRGLASHFDQLADLSNRPICYRLDYPRRFERLASVRQAIISHTAEEAAIACA